jgi:hypothetical protein
VRLDPPAREGGVDQGPLERVAGMQAARVVLVDLIAKQAKAVGGGGGGDLGLGTAPASLGEAHVERPDLTARRGGLATQTLGARSLSAAVTLDLGEGAGSRLGVSGAHQ